MKKISFLLLLLLPFSNTYASELDDTKSISDIIEESIPAVVTILTESNFFNQQFGNNPESYWEYIRPIYEFFWPRAHWSGSGFFISPDGYVVTNAHVVEDATDVIVVVHERNPRLYKAQVIGIDFNADLAVVKIQSKKEFPFLKFADSKNLRIGDSVIAIGTPLSTNLESTVTMGTVTAVDRCHLSLFDITSHVQTDASINGGNSGGPVLNTEGEVIGVVSWGLSNTWFDGVHFLIPSFITERIVAQLKEKGEAVYGYLGIKCKKDEEKAFDYYSLPLNRGACVKTILNSSPAQKMGLKKGDIIVECNGYPISNYQILKNHILTLPPGSEIELVVYREGAFFFLTTFLGKRELYLGDTTSENTF